MSYAVCCDQCDALAINGQPCHEQGCPNRGKPWIYDEEKETCKPGNDE